jgi:hypothetical protein
MTRMIGLIAVLFVLILTVFSPPSLASTPDSTTAIPSFDRSDTLVISANNEFSPDVVVKEQITQNCYPSTIPCNLWATSRTRGTVNLSWSYTGSTYSGRSRLYLVVERSTNRRTWSSVYGCRQAASSYDTSYYCSDSGLRSGWNYYYRVCATSYSGSCGTTNSSPIRSVRVQ